jgi:hypothetical protein
MVLWFLAGWSGASLLVGSPRSFLRARVIPGVALAVLVRWDPTGAICRGQSRKRIVRPINEFADTLSRRPVGRGAKQQSSRYARSLLAWRT